MHTEYAAYIGLLIHLMFILTCIQIYGIPMNISRISSTVYLFYYTPSQHQHFLHIQKTRCRPSILHLFTVAAKRYSQQVRWCLIKIFEKMLQNNGRSTNGLTCNSSNGSVCNELTQWGQLTHIYASKITIIVSENDIAPTRRQAIIWTNDG